MHRPRSGSVLLAMALAMAAVIPLLASPAGAVTTGCSSKQFPNRFGSQSRLSVDCLADAGVASNNIEVHDGNGAIWHHGAARTVAGACSSAACKARNPGAPWPASTAAVTHAGSAAMKMQTLAAATATVNGLLPGAGDVGRPVSAFSGATSILKGGTYIVSVTTFSGGVQVNLSQTAATSATSLTLKIEHTTSRVLVSPTCAAASTTITMPASPSGQKFQASDVGKSVSGGNIPAGDFIASVTSPPASSATLNVAANGTCGTLTELGAATYSGGVPVWNNDPMTIQLSRTTTGGLGFTCPSATSIAMTAASFNQTGGFVAADVGLNVTVRTSVVGVSTVTTTHTIGRITAVNLTAPTTATLTSTPANTACTGVVAPDATHFQSATIGVAGAGAPANSDAMMTLGAELNLNPTLVATQDVCTANTLEGFMVVGGWQNPGSTYANSQSTPTASVGQVLFPTSVLAFQGWVVPERDGVTLESNGSYTATGSHYTFAFPLLPTSLAECTSGGAPISPTGLEFTINPVTLSKSPFLPTGSGNIADPSVRSLLPSTSAMTIDEQQINNTGPVENSNNTTTCTPVALTVDPALGGSGCV